MTNTSTNDASRIPCTPLSNSKHEHFAHLLVKGDNPARAYIASGYSRNGALQSGNRLRRDAHVAARVEELKSAVSEHLVEKIAVDRAWVMARLTENANRAMQIEPVCDHDGNPTGKYTYQGGVANKALELLGKELGMFQPKTEPGVDIQTLMSILNAGRDRAAREKEERERKAAGVSENPPGTAGVSGVAPR